LRGTHWKKPQKKLDRIEKWPYCKNHQNVLMIFTEADNETEKDSVLLGVPSFGGGSGYPLGAA
jgi:hypothetical protein